MSAGTTLAGVAELVEAILLELPLADIICAQRVDRNWHGFIKNSPKLQKALFFRPSIDHTLLLADTSGWNKPLECANKANCYPEQRQRGSDFVPRYHDSRPEEVVTDMMSNPFPRTRILWLAKKYHDLCDYSVRLTRPEASWRKMLYYQPPVDAVVVSHGGAMHSHVIRAKPGSTGVTLGDLQESADSFYGKVRPVDLGSNIMVEDEVEVTLESLTAAHVLRKIENTGDQNVRQGEEPEVEDLSYLV